MFHTDVVIAAVLCQGCTEPIVGHALPLPTVLIMQCQTRDNSLIFSPGFVTSPRSDFQLPISVLGVQFVSFLPKRKGSLVFEIMHSLSPPPTCSNHRVLHSFVQTNFLFNIALILFEFLPLMWIPFLIFRISFTQIKYSWCLPSLLPTLYHYVIP